MPTVESSCPLDCPDSCSLEVRVDGGRVVSVGGSRVNPDTDGYICAKVRRYAEHMYGPERLLDPAIREGKKGAGLFRRASWDEALDRIAHAMLSARDDWGGDAILPYSYGGSNGYLTQDTVDARLWRRLGAARLDRTVCAAPTAAAAKGLYGKMPGVSLKDYAQANLIVLWGFNPSASGIHLVPKIYEAQNRGAKLVVVDPRATPMAAKADLHLAVRPGSDLPVALALVRWLFESESADLAFLGRHATGWERLREAARPWTFARAAEVSGTSPGDIEAFARMYAGSSPAVVRVGWGLERNRNGGSAAAAIMALPAVAGKFGVRGGGYTMSNSAAWRLDSISAAGEPEPATRVVNMNRLGEAIDPAAKPPVKVLFVYNSNALMTSPRQDLVRAGLEREDLFTVVFDAVRTDTALWADVVIPATTFLEHRELSRGYGAFVLHDSRPVVAPPGQARPNYDVFADLLSRTGLSRPGDALGAEALTEAILGASPRGRALRTSLDETGVAYPESGPSPIQFGDVFPRTSDGKAHLFPEDLDREAPEGLYAFQADPATARFPLALITPASDRTISSSLGELYSDFARLEIHPDDAGSRGVRTGDSVRVFNDFGEVRCPASVTAEVRPGVVRLPKGLWSRHTENGWTANVLAPDTLTDLGGGACFNDARVDVAPIGEAAAVR